MRAIRCLLALQIFCLTPAAAGDDESTTAPTYSAASIVNSASNLYGPLAPNTIVTLYGSNLSYATRAITGNDISGGMMPTILAGTGTRVVVNGMPAHLYYVSPTQINFLVPSTLLPGQVNLRIVRDGRYGPTVRLKLKPGAPALYEAPLGMAILTRPDGTVATDDDPARPGDVVILYGTGLGQTQPRALPGEIVRMASPVEAASGLQLMLDGMWVAPEAVLYAGLTPGFAGLYQINLRLPEETGNWPEIRVSVSGETSPEGVRIPVVR